MTDLTFISPPRISAAAFAAVLAAAHSPAAPEAAALYQIPASLKLDPAIALAFFQHESTYGTAGAARQTLNWGNLRSGPRQLRVQGGFAVYATWADGLRDWCDLILHRYVAQGLTTVRTALPVYAPSSDGNAPGRYADAVIAAVLAWQTRDPGAPPADPWASWGTAHPLDPAARNFGIPQCWLARAGQLGAAISEVEYADDGQTCCQLFQGGIVTFHAGRAAARLWGEL